MTKNKRYEKTSPQTQEEAMKAAKAIQRPGQTKEQTKLIAQGIEKGINHYKKQHKEKSRELNKKIQKVGQQQCVTQEKEHNAADQVSTVYKHAILPWVLLILSWVGGGAYFVYMYLFEAY